MVDVFSQSRIARRRSHSRRLIAASEADRGALNGEHAATGAPIDLAERIQEVRLTGIMRKDLDEAKAKFRIYPGGSVTAAITITSTTNRTIVIDERDFEEAPALSVQPVYRPSLILDLLVPLERAQDMHANLGDLFPIWVERHGVARAVWIRRSQVVLLIGGTWWEKALSTCERLLKVVRLIGS